MGGRSIHYILEGKVAHPVELLEWANWYKKADRVVSQAVVGDVRVSTVFLGIDHRFFGEGPPLLFETMVFGGPLDQETVRYSTYDKAEKGHAEMLARVAHAQFSEDGK